MLKRWQRVAWSTQNDPEAHRHMLACAGELNAGGDVATESWQVTKARVSSGAPCRRRRAVPRHAAGRPRTGSSC